jgi:hypothetical protein
MTSISRGHEVKATRRPGSRQKQTCFKVTFTTDEGPLCGIFVWRVLSANNGPSRTAALAKAISQLRRLHVPFPDGHAQHVQLPILGLAGRAGTLKMLTEQSAWMSASKF